MDADVSEWVPAGNSAELFTPGIILANWGYIKDAGPNQNDKRPTSHSTLGHFLTVVGSRILR